VYKKGKGMEKGTWLLMRCIAVCGDMPPGLVGSVLGTARLKAEHRSHLLQQVTK
jgi:hypothetical protein